MSTSKGLKHRAENDPRAASLLALSQTMRGGDSQAELDKVLAASAMPPSDKALCTELFYGTLRHHLRLEWFLNRKLSRPEGLPEEMRLLLEQSAYELAHTRTPAHAAVNWAVGLVRARFGQGLSKVANGVLRSFEREKKQEYLNPSFYAEALGVSLGQAGESNDPAELRPQAPANDLDTPSTADNTTKPATGSTSCSARTEALGNPEVQAIWHSMPLWLVRYWHENYPPAAVQSFLESATQPAPQAVRVNTRKQGCEEQLADLLNILTEQNSQKIEPAAWILPPSTRLPVSNWMKQGLASRQSPAAYAALFTLKPEDWPQPLWDACAGRGGKTLALLERGIAVNNATDPHKGRIQGLAEEYARLGLSSPPLPELKAATAQECGFEKEFRTVLVDAPCSGLGTLAHRPEIRWRRGQIDIQKLSDSQHGILEAAHNALIPEPGSRIVYLTCTMTRAANQEQAQAFIKRHPEYSLTLEYETPAEARLGEFFYAAVLERKV